MAVDAVTGLSKRQRLEKRRSTLESDRSPFMSIWKTLNDYILPTRGRFTVTDANKGDRRSKYIIDSTGTLAARTLASGMQSGITSPARPWFRITTPDPDLNERAAVKDWLFVITERIRWVLSRSNFYNKSPLIYQDMGVFGTSALMLVEDDHAVVRFHDFPIGTFCTALDDRNVPSILSREFRMSIRQLVQSFGLDKCSQPVQDQYRRGDLENMVEVVHFIEPNVDYDDSKYLPHEKMKWYSCYYEKGGPNNPDSTAFLRESGFEEFPCMIPRWEVTGEDVYGTNSPGISALGDIKQLQAGEKLSLQAVEKMVKPPLQGPTALRSVRVSTLPSDVTYVDTREGQHGLRPIHEVRFDVDKLEMKQQQCRNRIDRAFFADLFLMLSYMDDSAGGRDVTAAEIYERHEEKLLALGPVLEQLNQDFLDPVIDRTFNIMERRGFIPPAPPELEGMKLKTEYISIMHQAQKSTALQGLRSVMEFVLPLAERDPSVLDKIDTDRMIEHVAESAGTPPDIIVPQEDVQDIRKSRAEQQQQQQQSEQLATQAEASKKLSETDTSGQNALTDLMRGNTTPVTPTAGAV